VPPINKKEASGSTPEASLISGLIPAERRGERCRVQVIRLYRKTRRLGYLPQSVVIAC